MNWPKVVVHFGRNRMKVVVHFSDLSFAPAGLPGTCETFLRGLKFWPETNFGTNPDAILGCDLLRLAMRRRAKTKLPTCGNVAFCYDLLRLAMQAR